MIWSHTFWFAFWCSVTYLKLVILKLRQLVIDNHSTIKNAAIKQLSYRSIRSQIFFKILGLHRILRNSLEKTCARVTFLIKLKVPSATLLEKRLWNMCFPMNFAKFFKKTSLDDYFWSYVFWKNVLSKVLNLNRLVLTKRCCVYALSQQCIHMLFTQGRLHFYWGLFKITCLKRFKSWKYLNKLSSMFPVLNSMIRLSLMLPLNTIWKHQETRDFLMFSGVMVREYMVLLIGS